jgi:YYY domain-containing protein
MFTAIITYWFAALAFGIVGMPAARLLFGALPDRGYAFARTVGLLLTGYLAWLVAMFGLASFGAPLIVVAALAVLIGGVLALRHAAPKAVSPAGIVHWLRLNWGVIVFYEALFAAALVFLALLRAQEYGFVGPHPWGTERPMDYAFFNAIRVSAVFPPHDPWMSGYSINYYYFGYLLMAAVSLVTGAHPAVGYNMSLALTFALTALGIAGLIHNMVALALAANLRNVSRSPALSSSDSNRTDSTTQRADGVIHLSRLRTACAGSIRRHLTVVAGMRLTATGALLQMATPGSLADPAGLPADYRLQASPNVAADAPANSVLPIGEAERQSANPDGALPGAQRRSWQGWIAAVLTVVAVLLAGNQSATLQVAVGNERIVALDGVQLTAAIVQALNGAEIITLPYPARTGDFQEFATLSREDRIADFNWWWPSRVVWDERPAWNPETQQIEVVRSYAITEFPFFSFWLGDMHPHVMALPFGALALTLALNLLAQSAPPRLWRNRIELLLSGVILGSLYMINSWDLPTYLLLFLGALALKTATQPETDAISGEASSGVPFIDRLAPRWRGYLANTLFIIVASVLLIVPFLLTFTSLIGGRAPIIDLPLIGAITRVLGFVGSRTGLHSVLIIFGVSLAPLIGLTVALASGTARALLIAVGVVVVAGAFIGFPLAALLPLGLAAALIAVQRASHPADAFALGALALGSAIGLGVELVYIRDVFENRMNTVFKFYYQIWLIWGVAGGYAAWRLAQIAGAFWQAQPRRWTRIAALLAAPLVALILLASGLTYPWLTAGKAFSEGRHIGLEGRTPRERTPEGAEAINWVRANIPGDAVILEAVGPSYDTAGIGYGGVSSSTGRATVMGWEGHQQQWRGGDPQLLAQIAPRAADVAAIYSTTDVAQARALLATYGVDYIYVGEAERQTYPTEGLAKLAVLGEIVFQNSEVTIYRVRP